MQNLILTTLAFLSFSVHALAGDKIVGNGNLKKQTRSVSAFTKLEVQSAFEVIFTQAPTTSVAIETDENILPYVETELENNTLIVKLKSYTSINQKSGLKVYITVANLSSIKLSGATKMEATGDVNFNQLALTLSGASKCNLSGKINDCTIQCSGASKLNLKKVTITNATVEASGASKIELNVTTSLTANASGASDVLYKENDNVKVRQNTSGASKVQSF
ncbi:MAG: head GIN domain-containing protein [Chitinophagales bacterium]